nr:hypothetical protein [uncultured Devosia sp.]
MTYVSSYDEIRETVLTGVRRKICGEDSLSVRALCALVRNECEAALPVDPGLEWSLAMLSDKPQIMDMVGTGTPATRIRTAVGELLFADLSEPALLAAEENAASLESVPNPR